MPIPMATGSGAPVWPLPGKFAKQVWTTGGKRFGAARKGGKRFHAGIDIIAPQGAVVVAPESGTLIASQRFNGPSAHALLLQTHTGPVLLFGEVFPGSWTEFGLRLGSEVEAGQPIARVGVNPGGSTMLHFEAYTRGTRQNHRWFPGQPPPPQLLDPSEYLESAASQEGEAIEDVDTSGHPDELDPDAGDPQADDPGSSIDELDPDAGDPQGDDIQPDIQPDTRPRNTFATAVLVFGLLAVLDELDL